MYETMLFTIETTADHHQVPRVRINVFRGPQKRKPGQVGKMDAYLHRVQKHHWSPSSIRYLGNNENQDEIQY